MPQVYLPLHGVVFWGLLKFCLIETWVYKALEISKCHAHQSHWRWGMSCNLLQRILVAQYLFVQSQHLLIPGQSLFTSSFFPYERFSLHMATSTFLLSEGSLWIHLVSAAQTGNNAKNSPKKNSNIGMFFS